MHQLGKNGFNKYRVKLNKCCYAECRYAECRGTSVSQYTRLEKLARTNTLAYWAHFVNYEDNKVL
jgi:hypothetical protein